MSFMVYFIVMWPGTTELGGSRKFWKCSYYMDLKVWFASFKMMYNTSMFSKENS